jgi:hypothetical protein
MKYVFLIPLCVVGAICTLALVLAFKIPHDVGKPEIPAADTAGIWHAPVVAATGRMGRLR